MTAFGGKKWGAWGGLALLVIHTAFYRLQTDDAFISCRYARNLAQGLGLVFNPGEILEGYSNFSWVMLLAFVSRLGWETSFAASWLSVMSTCWMYREFMRLENVLAPVENSEKEPCYRYWLLAGSGVVAAWSWAGLEGPLYMALQLYLVRKMIEGHGRVAGVALLGISLTRIEGGTLVLPLTLWWWLTHRETGFSAVYWRAISFYIPAFLFYQGWRWLYFRDMVPNVVRARVGLDAWQAIWQGIQYIGDQIAPYVLICILYYFISVFRTHRIVDRHRWRLSIPFLLHSFLFILLTGGDWMAGGRYFLFSLPWLLLLLPALPQPLYRWRGVALALVILALHSFCALTMIPMAASMRDQVRGLRAAGKWLDHTLPKDADLALRPCGAMAYELGNRTCIDMFGLTDDRIAHNGVKDRTGTPGHVTSWDADVARRRPAVIVPGGAGFFSLPVFVVEPAFQKDYEAWVIDFPEWNWVFGRYLCLYVRRDFSELWNERLRICGEAERRLFPSAGRF